MKIILIVLILSFANGKIYIHNTVDGPSVEVYDCILHGEIFYCRRPTEPIVLNRDNITEQCYHNGIRHWFADLLRDNISISTVLHQWKSSIEKVEQYSRYERNSNGLNDSLCECVTPQSFGKNCEYLLPAGTTFEETLMWENSQKINNPWLVQLHGDIICYKTLECNFGLLCLDWRDICDDLQQCMSGIDEENCDKLEFNECEKDEYRCMNGMCIPEDYFLDGGLDCLDWSDEIHYYDDFNCPTETVSIQCDDRICPPYQYSCGDGQCIADRFEFQIMSQVNLQCRSRRDQYFICETHYRDIMWTLPSGRCYDKYKYSESEMANLTVAEECQYILRCDLSEAAEAHCPCRNNSDCYKQLNSTCRSNYIQYPTAGIMAPYVLFLYHAVHQLRPNFTLINGTIKCNGALTHISIDKFPFISQLHELENTLCQTINNTSVLNNHNQHALTFSNRSYRSSTICNKSKTHISIYRIKDGFTNCADKTDETANLSISTVCSNMERYRFHCYTNEPTCLSVFAFGNYENNCQNKFDELWFGTNAKLVDINCNKQRTDQCDLLRRYIKNSWVSNSTSELSRKLEIPFRSYCDTFWNLAAKEDENITDCTDSWICPEEQWQCDTGQCIDISWILDGEWDCADASDEYKLFDRVISGRNLKLIESVELINRSTKIEHQRLAFSTICNLTIEFPCLNVNFSGSFHNLTHTQLCNSQDRIGDGNIDCYGAIDERNVIEHLSEQTMLGYNFQCESYKQYIPYRDHCLQARCNTSFDDQFWCDHRANVLNCDSFSDAVCFNGTCVRRGRCNNVLDCHFGEDEYMCEHRSTTNTTDTYYRASKELTTKNIKHKLRLNHFPTNSNITTITKNQSDATQTTTSTVILSSNFTSGPIAYWCNRGVGVQMWNGSIICFCPPQYYGDKCQFHNDRIIVTIHLNLTQSSYTIHSNITIVLKLVVLFLFENEVITNHIFHVRPAVEMVTYKKKRIHFPYSRSFSSLDHKKTRYFNQSNIINEHPYSVRIEMYKGENFKEPLLTAVWQYPIYFDYLPVFFLSKVLHLNEQNKNRNPCLSKPCNENQYCQQLMNDENKYICLCKSNFTGENCSIKDQQCNDGYCGFGSLCKPNYRGLLMGNELPYCICSFNRYGERCDIIHDKCLPNPCEHNGSCFSTSLPNTVSCICTEEYHGKHCELKKSEVKLCVNESIDHIASVIQYFDIDFTSLDLNLVHQQVHRTLPIPIEYRHDHTTAPEIILVKLFTSYTKDSIQLYLISLHIDVTSIYATTQINQKNRCYHIDSLISNNMTQIISNPSPIKYHAFCQNISNLFCFRDDSYLCICSDNQSRVECFRYNYYLDKCSYCMNGGICVKGNRLQSIGYICLCPPCHSGIKCQFNSNSFGFTLDQLFYTDLVSINYKIIFRLLIIVPLLLFLLALPNNCFSIVTFRRQNCLNNSIGQYLLVLNIINQFNLGILAARLIHLAINITDMYSNPLVNNYLCKILNYLLNSSNRMVYWLSSLIAIERVYMTIFLNGRWLGKPHIARRLIILTFFGILISDIHELVFIVSLHGINKGYGDMCVIDFPINHRSIWLKFHLIISIINSILPLLVNIVCMITISYVVTQKKMKTRQMIIYSKTILKQNEPLKKESIVVKFRTRFHLMLNVLSDNKELIIGPGITLVPQLFSLPLFIISFTLYCQNLESTWMRYLLIASYFTSFIPQLTSFMLYIYPSSSYSKEWHATKISQWISSFFQQTRPIPAITIGPATMD
ncbi:unnamed protein product [Adineta steineri]|uniref:Uncharacterized protein n=2 Tax=Adineta steineri TaxID=433720 RepID=A0A819JPA8_9BILA|nr:unnamed protein product [Adineta steineri]